MSMSIRYETKRNDYIVDELPLLDQLNIKDLNDFTQGSLDTAINEIKHKYTSIDDDLLSER